ncbi:MAG: hypothetical protein M1834_009701 [Cirrosporium novae-zelandiae]|nr:MAG: hypothetical protein M1834_009701 [Cirrosporium novae-zelandiae]
MQLSSLPTIVTAILNIFGSSSSSSSHPGDGTSDGSSSTDSGATTVDWSIAFLKAAAFVSQLTNEEKLSLITGSSINSSSVTFEALNFGDGTEGVQKYYAVSGFSDPSALAMTWDKDLIYEQLYAVGTEFYLKGFQVINGPTSEVLGRTPWSGRLVEGLGQDCYLNGIAFGVGVKAFTDAGVIPGGKHFLLNEQETNRTTDTSTTTTTVYSSNVDDKTLHETYLWPFYDGVKAGLSAVMCAMTKVNGTDSCENNDLLNSILKTELGFPGMVYADFNAQKSGLKSAINGLDYGDADLWNDTSLLESIGENGFTQGRLDDMAVRNVIGYFYVGLDDGNQPSLASTTSFRDVRAGHSKIIRSTGAASMILLKNKNNALPLKDLDQMSIFGAHAGPAIGGPNQGFTIIGSGPIYQGHLATGSGSAEASLPYLVTPQQALTERAIEDGTMIRWILNDTYIPSTLSITALMALQSGTAVNPSIDNYAPNSDACIVFLNALAGEGTDRTELYNVDQDNLVTEVAGNCSNTIVVINTVAARILEAWIDHENVTAVLYSSLLGQESGHSITDVLYGDVNPSGRLPYTIAKNEDDYPVKICYTAECNFTEGVYIDYKWFDKEDITPRYAFGYGLSYTTFNYGDVTVSDSSSSTSSITVSSYASGKISVGGREDLWDILLTVTVPVTNNGSLAGHEVPQLYITYPDAASQPIRQLRGFERVYLEPGETTTVAFELRRRDLSAWDVSAQEWMIVGGTYTFSVGASSRDLRGSASVVVSV